METYDFSRPTHYTVGVFIIQNKKILFLKQTRSQYWLLPCGHIEDSELPHEAVVRETLEETGLKIELLEKPDEKARTKTVVPLPIPHHIQLMHCREKRDVDMIYTAKVIGGKLKINEESLEAEWLSKEEILTDPDVGPNTRYYACQILDENPDL